MKYFHKNKFLCLLLCILLPLCFCACSAKTAVTAKDFSAEAKKAGFTAESQEKEYGIAKQVTVKKGSANVTFLVLSDDETARNVYNNIKKSISVSQGAKNIDSSPYSRYEAVNGDKFHLLARMGSTIFFGDGNTSDKSAIENLAKSIKY